MNLVYSPDEETLAALQAQVDRANSAAAVNGSEPGTMTVADYLLQSVIAISERAKSEAISATAQGIEAAARSLPDDKRLAFTEEVKAVFQRISQEP